MNLLLTLIGDRSARMNSSKDIERDPGVHIGHVCVRYRRSVILLSGYKGYNNNLSANFRPSTEIYVFDELSETWSRLTTTGERGPEDVPKERSGASGTVIDDYLYLFGGYSENGNINSLYRLDFKSLKWRLMEPSGIAPLECDKSSCWEHDGKMYIFAGYGPDKRLALEEHNFEFNFDPASQWHYIRGWSNQFVCYDPNTNAWQWPKTSGQKPTARAAHAVVKVNNNVFLFGGRNGIARMNDMFVLNMKTLQWTQLMSYDANFHVKGRSWHTLTKISDNELILYGGFSQNNVPLNDCWKYLIDKNQWINMNLQLAEPRIWHSAILSPNGEIVVCGGAMDNITVSQNEKHAIFHKSMYFIKFQPRSLFRLSLAAAASESVRPFRIQHWDKLPTELHSVLNRRSMLLED